MEAASATTLARVAQMSPLRSASERPGSSCSDEAVPSASKAAPFEPPDSSWSQVAGSRCPARWCSPLRAARSAHSALPAPQRFSPRTKRETAEAASLGERSSARKPPRIAASRSTTKRRSPTATQAPSNRAVSRQRTRDRMAPPRHDAYPAKGGNPARDKRTFVTISQGCAPTVRCGQGLRANTPGFLGGGGSSGQYLPARARAPARARHDLGESDREHLADGRRQMKRHLISNSLWHIFEVGPVPHR